MNRLRKKLPLIATLAGGLAMIAIYAVGLAFFQSQGSSFYTYEQLLKARLIDVTIGSWLVYMGCAIGSFLNVVAWRMPRGEGINGSSHCPRCANTLIARDNFPVLGWISLRGRCRYCSLPISRRYPIVEAVVGVSLTLVGITQLYWLALPGQPLHWHGGPLWAPRVTPPVLIILSYHVVALSSLWAMALIRLDGVRLPKSILIWSGITLLGPMLVYPGLMIVSWQTTRSGLWEPFARYAEAPVRLITALVAAAFFARVLARRLCPRADLKLDPLGKDSARLIDLIFMLAIPAVLIGWQTMPAVIVAATLLSVLIRPLVNWIPINDGPKGQIKSRGALEYFAFALPIVLTVQLAWWRPLWASGFWPSDVSLPWVILIWAAGTLIVPSLVPKDAEAASAPRPLVSPDDDDEQDEVEDRDEADSYVADDRESDADNEESASTDELPDQQGDAETDHRDQG